MSTQSVCKHTCTDSVEMAEMFSVATFLLSILCLDLHHTHCIVHFTAPHTHTQCKHTIQYCTQATPTNKKKVLCTRLHAITSYFLFTDIHAPNPGNPVFTCDKEFTQKATSLVTSPSECTHCVDIMTIRHSVVYFLFSPPETQEVLSKSPHPMYVTTSSTYG